MRSVAIVVALGVTLTAQTGSTKTHRLEATPATVAYGYYWSDAKPVLRVASGERTRSEALGYGDFEFVPWQIGIVG